jgi:hypothetical protein
MSDPQPTIGSSLMEAMVDYARKIETIVHNDPENHVEQACLYSGISGINECYKMLKKNGFISGAEAAELESKIHQLYEMCSKE